MARVRTHYDNLKVSRDAPVEVIQAAYKSLAAKYHPDVNAGEQSARIMAIINRSYAVISDPEKRAEHDRWIAEAEEGRTTQRSFRDSIPRFQAVDIERRFAKWFIPAAIGLLACLFIGAMVFIVYRSASQTRTPAAQISIAKTAQPDTSAPAVPPSPPGFTLDQPPAPIQLHAVPAAEPKILTAVPKAQPTRSEIDEVIQSGKYSALPPAEVVGQSDSSGPPQIYILNETGFTLSVTFYGSVERSVKIADGNSLDMELPPGDYRVLGRATIPTVIPFVGSDKYAEGTKYEQRFYVKHQIIPIP